MWVLHAVVLACCAHFREASACQELQGELCPPLSALLFISMIFPVEDARARKWRISLQELTML